MKFIEVTGTQLRSFVFLDESIRKDIEAANLEDHSILRVNQQGDIEIRRHDRWDLIGGLLGEFEPQLHEATGLDWA